MTPWLRGRELVSVPFGLERDVKLLQGFFALNRESNETLAWQFQRHASRTPEQLFLKYQDRSYSYGEANAIINRHAYAYKVLGIDRGDVVALALENRPEYVFHTLALHKIGAVASLINTHGTGDVLAHAIRICSPKHVVVGSEIWEAFAAIRGDLGELSDAAIDVDMDPEHPIEPRAHVFQARLEEASEVNPPEAGEHTLGSLAAFIYTSGTTGLPKAAKVSHLRMYRAGRVWAGAGFRYRQGDRLYNCLPLYHSNGFMLGLGSAITAGVAMVLARKFSASRFWGDVREGRCTNFIYIGELCRYLMNHPPSPDDRNHQVRVISGNGLRPDIWEEFQARFGIKRIAEFYGATEGNCITINFRGVVGSVGPLLPGMVLARWDADAQDFVRGEDGYMVRAKRGESGILLGRERPSLAFEGYQDKKASEGKLLRNVFHEGDCYFDTGDLLRMDHAFNLYFVDRLGDTFRWKGENVATFEVQEQISKWGPVAEVNVYGVRVPGTDGRAGMASIVLANGREFDPVAFRDHVDEVLPAYARPLFVRLRRDLDKTGTLKMKKADLQEQGYDPGRCTDPLFFRDPEQNAYVPLNPEVFEGIAAGRFRL